LACLHWLFVNKFKVGKFSQCEITTYSYYKQFCISHLVRLMLLIQLYLELKHNYFHKILSFCENSIFFIKFYTHVWEFLQVPVGHMKWSRELHATRRS